MDMTGQPRLFKTAVEAAHVSLIWGGHQGWSVSVAARRQGDTWSTEPNSFYGGLTTDELLDVITAELSVLLGVA